MALWNFMFWAERRWGDVESLEEEAPLRLPWGLLGPTTICPNVHNYHTLERSTKSDPISRWHFDHKSLFFSTVALEACLWYDKQEESNRMRGGCREGGGGVGPTSGRLDRSRLKGARPCLGLPAIHTTFISVCFLAMSSSNIGVCIYMIVKSGRVETFKKSF